MAEDAVAGYAKSRLDRISKRRISQDAGGSGGSGGGDRRLSSSLPAERNAQLR